MNNDGPTICVRGVGVAETSVGKLDGQPQQDVNIYFSMIYWIQDRENVDIIRTQ